MAGPSTCWLTACVAQRVNGGAVDRLVRALCDDIGSLCDADVTGPGAVEDCFVNFLDLQVLKDAFFSNPAQPEWHPDADFDNSGLINFADLQILKEQLFGPPGPSGLPNSCGP